MFRIVSVSSGVREGIPSAPSVFFCFMGVVAQKQCRVLARLASATSQRRVVIIWANLCVLDFKVEKVLVR